jgi:long-chain acyl-CoA synthetase
VMAAIQPAADAEPGPELTAELTQWCRERLARYKVPRAIDFVTDFPREENGKLYKRRLRDGYWKDHESRLI